MKFQMFKLVLKKAEEPEIKLPTSSGSLKKQQLQKNIYFCFIDCSKVKRRRRWHPTPLLLPGKSHGWRSLVDCSWWGREVSDTTERFHFHFSLHALEKEMATLSSVLAWRIPGTGEPGWWQSMGSHRVRHDWSNLAATATFHYIILRCMYWTWNNRLVPNRKRSASRLYIVTLLI